MFSESPFWIAVLALFGIAFARGQLTYWIARVVAGQTAGHTPASSGWRARVHRWLHGDAVARGRRALESWGLVLVPLCYLTVGTQTVVLAAAGVVQMNWARFSLAQIPGALAWAFIYATIGFAAWDAAVAAAAGSPWGLIALGLLIGGTTVWLIVRVRRRRAALH